MDLLATACLTVIAIAALVIGHAVHGMADDLRVVRKALDELRERPEVLVDQPSKGAAPVEPRGWEPADAT